MTEQNTILIVDDEFSIRKFLEAILSTEGYELIFAENGKEGFEKAKEIKPALVLLDVMMPIMDGFQVCALIREDIELSETPVILITALDDMDSRIRAIELGADDFVTKPIDRIELISRIKTIIRLKRSKKLFSEKNENNKLKAQDQLINKLQNEIARNQSIANQIVNNLQPPLGFLTGLLQGSFVYFKENNFSGNCYSIAGKNNKVYIFTSFTKNSGIVGALMCSLAIALFKRFVEINSGIEINELLIKINNEFCVANEVIGLENSNAELTMTLCSIDTKTQELEFTSGKNTIFFLKEKELFNIPVKNNEKVPNLILNNGSSVYFFAKEQDPGQLENWLKMVPTIANRRVTEQMETLAKANFKPDKADEDFGNIIVGIKLG